ncbi:hypothetical protein R3P38DRAFT_3546841 [Favolaschia claudopus]|uniref:Uncharacterized protein n=1 Tax=Favolaschia claudopus TaxID=2862362 RepID=A0AAW0E1Y4_9AGAR
MTEYDYSPDAIERYHAKLAEISRWTQKTANVQQKDPFTPQTPANNANEPLPSTRSKSRRRTRSSDRDGDREGSRKDRERGQRVKERDASMSTAPGLDRSRSLGPRPRTAPPRGDVYGVQQPQTTSPTSVYPLQQPAQQQQQPQQYYQMPATAPPFPGSYPHPYYYNQNPYQQHAPHPQQSQPANTHARSRSTTHIPAPATLHIPAVPTNANPTAAPGKPARTRSYSVAQAPPVPPPLRSNSYPYGSAPPPPGYTYAYPQQQQQAGYPGYGNTKQGYAGGGAAFVPTPGYAAYSYAPPPPQQAPRMSPTKEVPLLKRVFGFGKGGGEKRRSRSVSVGPGRKDGY